MNSAVKHGAENVSMNMVKRMKPRRIEVFKNGGKVFEYFSDLIPREGEFVEWNEYPFIVESVEYVVKYNVVIGVKVGVE